ncbi:putative GTPase activator protein [Trypanosoma rangeli]|uniref:Putative GTPase activator protein n=1 Tax=Trypanosoma rangeli TaxID=5698 RepID=A0A422NEE6_TRYRA|nr:putative GTPase activator protein [Trypanosoma rangeli]RNF03846.1 putative GTPase activator protein [Trypanosoma rangeli]|eukprot:RNF03846.1 putative GTPase activator protein [Trypanosoma rangeli]
MRQPQKRENEKEGSRWVWRQEDPQRISKAYASSGYHQFSSSAPLTEPYHGEYCDYFACTGFVEQIDVNAWHPLKETNFCLERAWEELGDDHEPAVVPAFLVGTTRWWRMEDSVGHEMESIHETAGDQAGTRALSTYMCEATGEGVR